MEFMRETKYEKEIMGVSTPQFLWFKTGGKVFAFSMKEHTIEAISTPIETLAEIGINGKEILYQGDTINFKL